MPEGCDLVLIEWLDSRQPTASWQLLRDLVMPEVCRCVSVGFLIHDDETRKVLAANMADVTNENLQASGIIVIPTLSVLNVVRLCEEN